MTSCQLELLGDGFAKVRWRSLVTFPAGARRLVFRLSASHVRDVQCEGSGGARPTVVRLGRRVAVLLELEVEDIGSPKPGTANQSSIELTYTCRARQERWTRDISVWSLTRDVLPRLYFGRHHGSRWLHARSDVTHRSEGSAATQVSVNWDAAIIRVFGPVSDPSSGFASLVLSKAELADFQVYFGKFHLGAREEGLAVWVPASDAQAAHASSYERVVTEAARVRAYLVGVFGNPRVTVENVVLAPALAGPARFFGSTVLIRDPHDAVGELTVVGEADLLAQLAHELSHGWWVPAVIEHHDSRVWGLIEGIAIAAEFLALTHFLSDGVQKQVMPRRKAHHCDLVTRRFGELRRHYRSQEAAAGLRFGYVLIALSISRGRTILGALRQLLQSFNANGSGRDGLPVQMEVSFGRELTGVLLEVLDRPRPPIASVRVKRNEQESCEVSLRFATVEEAAGFLRLLHATEAFADQPREVARRGREIRLTLKPLASADWLQYLTPGFMVDRRVVQWNRVGSNGVLRVLSETAWGLRTRPGHHGVLDRLRYALVGLAAMIVESEAAVGFELVADALEGWITPLARRLRKAASYRAPW